MTGRDDDLEPERYELEAPAAYRFELERRGFLGTLGGGLIVLWLPHRAASQADTGAAVSEELGAWLRIGADGLVTVFTGKVEFGQDIRTSLTQVVVEELPAPIESVRLVMGDTDLVPYDRGTFGSRTTPAMAPQLRKVAAAAREALLDLAAAAWSVEKAGLAIAEGRVTHAASRRSTDFGALTKGQAIVKTLAGASTTPADRWTVAGRSLPKVGGRDLVTGRHEYTADLKRPGMLHGKVLRPPSLGAVLVSVDTRVAAAIPGITVVRDGDFIGVTGPTSRVTEKARDSIHAEWKATANPVSSTTLFDSMKAQQQPPDGRGGHQAGSLDEALASAPVTLGGRYTVAYIAHAPLEPRAAVAEWDGGKLTVWTGTQRPFGVRSDLAAAFHLAENKVRVIVPDTGAGYGGKHSGDAAIEAARLAKAAGRPVRLVWTREEEFRWAYFRPAGVIDVRSGTDRQGRLLAWDFHNVNSGSAGIRTPYAVANQNVQFHPSPSPLRQGSYRGLAATANHFARETHMDEMAGALALDPLELRRRNLEDPRLRAVLEAAAARFAWDHKATKGHGHGLAVGFEKGSYVATCAEVAVDRPSGRVRVVRLVTAFECGAILNPDHLKSQVEGGVLQGIGGALFEAIEFADGRIRNASFSSYRVPRFSDAPTLETVLLDRRDLPSVGAGETPIVGVAPAIGNAIFNATGVRLRALPLAPGGVSLKSL